MANTFAEFDSTIATLPDDLRTAILASTDWADLSPLTPSTTTTSASTAGTSTLGVAVASSTGFSPGMVVVIDPGPNQEFKTVVNLSSGLLNLGTAGWGRDHASGVVIRNAATVLKATTTRGVEMVVDLAGGSSTVRQTVNVYRSWDAGVGTDQVIRHLSWHAATGAITDTLHVVVAAGKEHLFFSVEGPRAGESNADSTTLGSYRTYLALCDLVPYMAADTVPAVVLAGYTGTATTDETPWVHVSRNQADIASWVQARMGTVAFPAGDINSVNPVPLTFTQPASDGNTYLFPYVVVENNAGLRGRLPILHVGYNVANLTGEQIVTPGALFTVGGAAYRAVGTHKSPSTNATWGPFGASQGTGTTVVVAVPI